MSLFGSVIPSDAQGGFSFRNKFINGAMQVWQRGTTFASIGTVTYSTDRWFSNYGGTAPTFSRSTDAPTGFQYSISLAGSSTSYHGIGQRIESINTAELSGQVVTLSFYAKLSSGTATNGLGISVSYANSVDNFSATTAVLETNITSTVSGSWTRYSYTFTVPAAAATNGFSVVVFNQSATQTFTMLLTGMQLERGSVATPFEFRHFSTELALCQRYFEKSWQQDMAIGSSHGVQVALRVSINSGASNYLLINSPYKVTKRVSNPAVVVYDALGRAGKININDSISDPSNITPSSYGTAGDWGVSAAYSGSFNGISYAWSSNAEL